VVIIILVIVIYFVIKSKATDAVSQPPATAAPTGAG
jgi:hypothetical protein